MTSTIDSSRRFRGLTALWAAPQPYCQVCFGPETRLQVLHDRHSRRKLSVRVCGRCGYVEVPDNSEGQAGDRPSSVRREREMAKLGVDVLDRPGLSVLSLGEHPDLLWANAAEANRYDVVVAADLIDRFEDPLVDFERLFALLKYDGLLICSSTIHDGGPLGARRHIFGRGLGSYYTVQSLRRIASVHNVRIDLRLPPQVRNSAARRRYVIFSRSGEVMTAVAAYFDRGPDVPAQPTGLSSRLGARRAAAPTDRTPTDLA